MEIEDEIRGNSIKDEVRKLYLLEKEWISGYVTNAPAYHYKQVVTIEI